VADAGSGAPRVTLLPSETRKPRRKRASSGPAGSGIQDDGTWVAQFPGQRPPFAPGNQLGTTSGAHTAPRVLAVSQQIVSGLLADPDCPDYLLNDGSYRHALELWGSAMAQCVLLRTWLDTQDIFSAMSEITEGTEEEERTRPGMAKRTMRSRRVASVLDQLHKAETRAMHLSTRLGLDPLARARLGADLAGAQFDIAKYWETRAKAARSGNGESA
jgi:hypothetical protein